MYILNEMINFAIIIFIPFTHGRSPQLYNIFKVADVISKVESIFYIPIPFRN